jgi:FtsH-binding integral membrane protein
MDNYNQQNFSRYTVLDSQPVSGSGAVAKKFMANVFLWMFIALGISSLFAFLYASNQTLLQELYNVTETGALRPTVLGWVVTFAPLAFVLIMQFGMGKLSSSTLTFLFVCFAAVMGISLSYILLIYTSGSVITCFAASSAMFGIMAFLGYTTDKDLTSFGRILGMGFWGIFIACGINFFIGSPMLNYIISIVGVAVFTGLTAYDTQRLKRIGAGLEYEGTSATDTKKLALMGALSLYLDFLNLFLMLLSLFGDRRK